MILASNIFQRKITEVIPLLILGCMLFVYPFCLLGGVRHIVLFLGAFLLLLYGVSVYAAVRSKWTLSSVFCNVCKKEEIISIVIYLFAICMIIFCFHTHFITNWDDLNYWAVFPRNMQAVDCMPTGTDSCTTFRDYSPIIQQFYFLGFKLLGRFSEPMMFIINNVLLYTFLLPFLSGMNSTHMIERVVRILLFLSFPHILMFQQLHCLGVDCIMGILFGYLIYGVYDDRKDVFYYLRIFLGCSVLVLSKTSGILFVFIIMLLFIIENRTYNEWKNRFMQCVTVLFPLICALSWSVFCRLKGNSSYLSQRVEGNLSSQGKMQFASYSGKVVWKFLKSFVTFPLNGGRFGLSPLLVLCIIGILLFQMKKKPWLQMGILFGGYLLYCVFLLYTYLFVFDDWEALSLSSYDRYMSVYLAGMLYFIFIRSFQNERGIFFLSVIAFLCILTINIQALYTHLFPNVYNAHYEKQRSEKEQAEEDMKEVKMKLREARGKLLIVCGEENIELEKYYQYATIPIVSEIFSADSKEPLRKKAEERDVSYIYFMKGRYSKKFLDKEKIKPGEIYQFHKKGKGLEELHD